LIYEFSKNTWEHLAIIKDENPGIREIESHQKMFELYKINIEGLFNSDTFKDIISTFIISGEIDNEYDMETHTYINIGSRQPVVDFYDVVIGYSSLGHGSLKIAPCSRVNVNFWEDKVNMSIRVQFDKIFVIVHVGENHFPELFHNFSEFINYCYGKKYLKLANYA
jgi:hypothetical protein